MPALLKVLTGLGALLLFGVAGIHWNNAAGSAEGKVRASVEKALAEAGHGWARIDADGQKITIYGDAPSDDQLNDAIRLAKTAAGPGGPFVGGVTVLTATDARVNEIAVAAQPTPEAAPEPVLPTPEQFLWRADYDGDQLTLSGFAPSDSARRLLLEAAQREFRSVTLIDKMTLAQGAREGPWLLATSAGVKSLAALERGTAVAVDEKFSVDGVAANEFQATIARQLLATLPEPYEPSVSIDVNAPPPPAEPEPEPVLALSEEEIARLCQSEIDELMLGRQITFASNRASVTAASRETLSAIALAVIECSPAEILIEGHTDATGRAAKNLSLSQARAEAVKAVLVSEGVNEAILFTQGFGETRPVATNATASGRATNRRIAFVVKGGADD